MKELDKRSKRFSPFIIKKLVVRMLRDNGYDLKFSRDARTMQKGELLGFMNVNIIPQEVHYLISYNMTFLRLREFR